MTHHKIPLDTMIATPQDTSMLSNDVSRFITFHGTLLSLMVSYDVSVMSHHALFYGVS